jgi:hypothetical protein
VASGADPFGLRSALGLTARQARAFSGAIALDPLSRTVRAHPLWCPDGQRVEGVVQRRAHTLQTIQDLNRGPHRGGVGPLLAPRLQPLALAAHLE